jgi:class 3 adenylate cyclase
VKILVVDDNRDNIELVRDILEVTGHTIFSAFNGADALEIAEAELPDLIILDVNMPHMNGFEVCRRLKEGEQTNEIPVMMLTAQDAIESRVEGLSSGADDYLTKPFSPRELMARVDRSLRSKAISDDMRSQQALLRKTFSRFVAAPIVDQLLENPEQVRLGGTLQPVTVLFADLQGFTTLSELTEPQTLLQLLNSYHTYMMRIVLQYGGTIDKFLGDGLMALFNTPVQQDDHVARAVKTALHIQDDLHWFAQELPEDHRLLINFGIHTGTAIVGNVGSENLMDFTAVGDTVNVAARLQGVADNGQILVSKEVFNATQDFVFGRSRGQLRVKGRTNPVDAYEISNTYFE